MQSTITVPLKLNRDVFQTIKENMAPANANITAIIKAVVNDFTSKPLKNASAILIIIAVTNSLTKKLNKKRVNRFNGKRKIAPIVAFKMAITSATPTAVP